MSSDKTKFGKLTVLRVNKINGVQFADVQCECGTERTVPYYRVTSGGIKSCGARECRRKELTKKQIAAVKRRRPRGPALPWTVVERMVSDYAKGKLTLAAIAQKHTVSPATVVKYNRLARVYGSIDAYRKSIESRHAQE